MKKSEVAIFGATSHIAKGLIKNFIEDGHFGLHLFARSPEKVKDFLTLIGFKDKTPDTNCIVKSSLEDFSKNDYAAVINCVGVGTLNKHKGEYSAYFTVTEEYDNLVISYLRHSHTDTIYVSFSSGAVYGRNFAVPADENTANSIYVNHLEPEDYYAIARLNAEAKHRSFKDLNIVDFRLFSYFSRFIDLADGYFITELLNCILLNKIFVTNDINIVRDYVHPDDLFKMILRCVEIKKINGAFDVASSGPVEKTRILEYFSDEYDLKYKVDQSMGHIGATGLKNKYFSNYKNAEKVGYKPKFSSMDTIKEESRHILDKKL